MVVNVSYFFSFVDDPTVDVSSSSPNVQRGAAILFATAEFRKLVVTGQLPYERVGKKKTPICATAYKYMFNACRISRREQDSYCIYDPSRYTHCIVSRKGHFFSIQLVHPETGNPLRVTELEDQLRQCIALADAIPSTRPKLGLMTSGNRDDWADARQEILATGGSAMEEALEILQSGAILLNLDDESPVSRQELGDLYWTGGSKSGENRWFDKSIQIMVTNNGKAGLIAEHSMMSVSLLLQKIPCTIYDFMKFLILSFIFFLQGWHARDQFLRFLDQNDLRSSKAKIRPGHLRCRRSA